MAKLGWSSGHQSSRAGKKGEESGQRGRWGGRRFGGDSGSARPGMLLAIIDDDVEGTLALLAGGPGLGHPRLHGEPTVRRRTGMTRGRRWLPHRLGRVSGFIFGGWLIRKVRMLASIIGFEGCLPSMADGKAGISSSARSRAQGGRQI